MKRKVSTKDRDAVFWRCGWQFTNEPRVVEVTEEQAQMLEQTPALVVEAADETGEPKHATRHEGRRKFLSRSDE